MAPYMHLLWKGLGVTFLYTIGTVISGVAIGLIVGLVRTNASTPVALPFRAYVEVFRCTPLLVQLVWMYYALPVLLGVSMSAATAAFLSLTLYGGSFYSEIFRGGIKAIDKGQWEAGHAIGMRRGKIFRRIILPQAVKVMIPAFINQTVMQLKNTSLVSTVAVGDLLYQGSIITSTIYRPLEVYTLVAALYFMMLFPLTLVSGYVERRMEIR
ncbi:amino acid ABC transporter permease [Acuticoccus sp. 2012]|uniref:Amino acid ABC transporter permease n=2 Tax=Acuticoccus mangrovi TaxID=2796142 RepID=A0A934ISS8_9HYPH|nr:amino acid ABC transporter permease [Acuticoccus mangrovi]